MNWKKYMRGWSEFPRTFYHQGSFNCAYHLGKGLTQDLWNDLAGRLHVQWLQIVRESGPWATGTESDFEHGPSSCTIILDDNKDIVVNIIFQPWYQ